MHPNSIRIKLKEERKRSRCSGEQGRRLINIAEVNGFKADFSASLNTIILFADDIKGSIAFIASVLAHDDWQYCYDVRIRKGKK